MGALVLSARSRGYRHLRAEGQAADGEPATPSNRGVAMVDRQVAGGRRGRYFQTRMLISPARLGDEQLGGAPVGQARSAGQRADAARRRARGPGSRLRSRCTTATQPGVRTGSSAALTGLETDRHAAIRRASWASTRASRSGAAGHQCVRVRGRTRTPPQSPAPRARGGVGALGGPRRRLPEQPQLFRVHLCCEDHVALSRSSPAELEPSEHQPYTRDLGPAVGNFAKRRTVNMTIEPLQSFTGCQPR